MPLLTLQYACTLGLALWAGQGDDACDLILKAEIGAENDTEM
jgi:hypothetical protein